MKKIAAFVLALVLALGFPAVCFALDSANSGGRGVNASSQQSTIPERPVPTGMLAYWDEAEALIAAAPVTVEEVDSVLAPFGLDCSNLSEITNGVFTQADIEHGRVDAEYWAQLGEIFSVQKEAYAFELLAYERNYGNLASSSHSESYASAASETSDAIEEYRMAAKRSAYISSLDLEEDIIYVISPDEKWVVGEDMVSGVYMLLYTGQGWARVSIKSGVLTETEYEFANYSWSVAEKTRYDEFAFPLVEGCTLSCETSKQDDFDCVWLIRLSDVD